MFVPIYWYQTAVNFFLSVPTAVIDKIKNMIKQF